jgi:serine protease Do
LLLALALLIPPAATLANQSPEPAAPVADLEAVQRAFQQVVERVSPSVVGIRAHRRLLAAPVDGSDAAGAGVLEQRVIVNGTGTIITADGLILTNEHVIQATEAIEILFSDSRKTGATVLAVDPRSDLAILRVPRSGLTPAAFGDWSAVARGQWCVVSGNPYGLGSDGQLSVSVGTVANLGRQLPGLGEVDDRFYSDMIQITAPISPGNSGGPLFNIRGELIGVVTAMHTRTPTDEGIGFAIPLSPPKRAVLDTLCQGQPVQYGYLGLTVRSAQAAEREGHSVAGGVVVQKIEPNGPADQAQLEVGDVILQFHGRLVHGPAHLAELAGQTSIGTTVSLDVARDGAQRAVPITVALRDVSRVAWMRNGTITWRGMRLADLSADARHSLHIEGASHGVVVLDIEAGTPASRGKVQVGDVIEKVGAQPVQDTIEFLARVQGVGGTLEVSIRNGGTRTIVP